MSGGVRQLREPGVIHFGCIKNGDSGTYVGRACYGYPESPLHNPFRVGTVPDAIEAYRTYLRARVEARDPGIIQELKRLKALAETGELTLLCWCRPKQPCHARVIAEFLEQPVPDPQPKTLYLVDSFAHIYRAHYANPNLSNGAAFFFTRMLQSLMRTKAPQHLMCVFDTDGGSHHRYALHPDYKQGRASRPIELDAQIPMVKSICKFMGWNPIESLGAEADDIMATLATRAAQQGFDRVVLVTPDKDLCQLVDDTLGISVFYQKEGLNVELNEQGVKERLGVEPKQVVDYLTLLGDTSDNVPGVEGIGDKGAASLLGTYGTLDTILANIGKLRASYQEGLRNAGQRLAMTRELVTVQRNLDLPIDLTRCTVNTPDADAQAKFFGDMGFRSLAPGRSMDDMESLRPSGVVDAEFAQVGRTFDDLDEL